MRHSWWKVVSAILVLYAIVGGILLPAPRMHILNETIRNLYFHVPMWFTMIALFTGAFAYSLMYLRTGNLKYDIYASELTNTGILFSICGMLTGMIWANYTWGTPWSNDAKELGTALCMLIYFAYLVLRNGLKDEEKRARIGAVYNVFAYALMIPLIFVLPRVNDSLHPGNGGNPAFGKYDLDNGMRLIFYPAIIGWIMLGVWIATLRIRLGMLIYEKENLLPGSSNNHSNA